MSNPKTEIFISVILSTYNQPEWLKKVLWGYNFQTFKNFEIVVADDGSEKETANLINHMQKHVFYHIEHCWHEDEGFRKCGILNRAIQRSRGEYLIFSDGDCIPRSDFVSVHNMYKKQNTFLSGGMYRTSMEVAHGITLDSIESQECFNIKTLKRLGQPSCFFKDLKCTIKYDFCKNMMNFITPTKASWNGHNSSGWKTDILSVNGFDERMKYGGEDRELGERLKNKRLKSRQIRYSAICLHLEHSRGYVTKEDWVQNNMIRKATKKNKTLWTIYGINKEV